MATNWGSVWYLQITLFVELCYRIDLGDNPFPCYETTAPRNQDVLFVGIYTSHHIMGGWDYHIRLNWNCEFSMFPLSNPRAEPNRSCKHFCKWTNSTPWICHLKIYQKYVLYMYIIYIYMYMLKLAQLWELSQTLDLTAIPSHRLWSCFIHLITVRHCIQHDPWIISSYSILPQYMFPSWRFQPLWKK